MMQRFTPAVALSLVALFAPSASASKPNFHVYNSSGYTLQRLYVSASHLPDWNNDILGNTVLRHGGNTRVIFGNPSSERCLYDFRAVFSNGSIIQDMKVNVCNSRWLEYR